MPNLVIQHDQSGAAGKEVYNFDGNINATEMIMKHFPNGIDPDNCKIFINSIEVNIKNNLVARLFETLNSDDVVLVLKEVKGLNPITIAILVIAAIAVVALTPKLPGNVGQRKDSPNNKLQGQTNIARPYQAYPLIFGSPRVYPDLTGEPVIEYIDNQKIVTQLMNIGVGLFDITDIRAGETPLSNFPGSTSTIYEPVSKVVTVPIVTTSFASNEIDGQELLGTNEGLDGTTYNLVENGASGGTYVGSTFTITVDQDAVSDALKIAFDAAIGDFNVEATYFLGGINKSGSGRMTAMTLLTTVYTVIISGFTGPKTDPTEPLDYLGPYSITVKLGSSIGPIKTSVESEQFWVDIIFQRGLIGTVNITLTTQELDGPNGTPIGSPSFDNFSFTEDTLDQQFFTHKKTLASKSFYQFTVERTNNSLQDTNNPDQAKLESVRSINTFTNLTFGNNTLIKVVVPATINATSLRENKINLSLTKKTITYDGVNVITTPAASRKMADALLHLYVDFFGLDKNTLALDELYEIQNRLDAIDPRLATFDFTFDDIDVSLDERMDAILQVARCFKWLDGDVYRFARDEKREFAATTITRRDIASEDQREYSISYNPQLLEAFDSVKVEFVDRSTNKKAYIFRSFDPASPDPQNPLITNVVGSNPKTMEIAGCSEEFNAINRAELEIRKLIYQRWSLNETMLPSGMLLSRGDMVLYAEQYSSDLFDGEILAINGNIATTSESIDFSVGTLELHYMLDDGTKVGPFSITEVVGEPFKFESADLGQAFVRDSTLGFSIQTGSRYIIGTTTKLDAARWTVVEKEARGNNVQLSMITYDDRIYDFD